MSERPPAPDQAARDLIRERLDVNLLVEAGAGSGKTECLAQRMAMGVLEGRYQVQQMAAVTFTRKAAAELRARFQLTLESALAAESDPVRRERALHALRHLERLFAGTIHAFCAHLLRERPVEAGVAPGFSELDEVAEVDQRRWAWRDYLDRQRGQGAAALRELLDAGVRPVDLDRAFEKVCNYPEVAFPAGDAPRPDPARARAALEGFWAALTALLPDGGPREATCSVQKRMREFTRRLRVASLDDPRVVAELAAEWESEPRVVQKWWPRGKADKERVEALFTALHRETLPFLDAWLRYVYRLALTLLLEGREHAAAARRRAVALNYNDLLQYAAALLRDNLEVRAALQEKYRWLFVDEFQDTDPIQAEILFFLTGAEVDERDWRQLVPLPGSLFVVGDPKQSIYRFRRADIETYAAVRDRIERAGKVLNLSANFRGTGHLCQWVNGVFSRDFPQAATAEQAAWVPLEAQRPEGAPGVFRLLTRTPTGAAGPVVAQDSARIAGAIAAAIGSAERAAGDFLVLFRTRKYMAEYARALESRGIAYELSGGGAFKDSEELQTLLPLLLAISDPDDPVPFTAVLRGPLFGVDDEALYGHARAGGRFSFRAVLPEGADPRIAKACALLSEGEGLAAALPPGAAIARLCGRLGWTAYSSSRELADSRAGNLLKAIAAARTFSADGLDFAGVVAELDRLSSEGYIEEMGARPGRRGAVRLMTLHGAKGLEAPVVFLADPRRESNRPTRFSIDRRGASAEGHWRVIRETDGFGVIEIAEPRGWATMAQIEKAFDDAEKKRLLYVAATRAKEMLVVSVWKQGKSENPQGAWAPLDAFLTAELPEAPAAGQGQPAPRMSGLPAELEAFSARRRERRAASAGATYAVVPVTDVAHAGHTRPGWQRTGRGMSWGRVLHGVLEAVMRDAKLDVATAAANLLAEEDRPAGDVPEVVRVVEGVRASELWKRALAAPRRLVEVPFALEVPRAELGFSEGPDPVLLQGAIDLVFEEEEGWALVDYKSDTVAGNRDALVAFYSPQIAIYRRYWERLTGRPTRAGLHFIDTGETVWP